MVQIKLMLHVGLAGHGSLCRVGAVLPISNLRTSSSGLCRCVCCSRGLPDGASSLVRHQQLCRVAPLIDFDPLGSFDQNREHNLPSQSERANRITPMTAASTVCALSVDMTNVRTQRPLGVMHPVCIDRSKLRGRGLPLRVSSERERAHRTVCAQLLDLEFQMHAIWTAPTRARLGRALDRAASGYNRAEPCENVELGIDHVALWLCS